MDTRNTLCEQAKPHYYDMLCGQNFEAVPDYIAFHVQQCWYCQKQIDGLKRILIPVSGKTDSAMADAAAITDVLRLHLAYMDKNVSCRIVKPFIPSMLIPSLEVRVPTPITAHFDKCSKCAQDLEMLRYLNLSRRQLRRLSEFFTEDTCSCLAHDNKRQKEATQFADLDWKNLDAEALRHLCKCPQCRQLVYNQRQMMLGNLTTAGQDDQMVCEAILTGGFFDFVFPYGLEASGDQYADFRRTFSSHIKNCPDCVSRMQRLHEIIYQIIECPDSGVITVFSKQPAVGAEPLEICDIAYEGYPVKVDVAPPQEQDEKVVCGEPAGTEHSRSAEPAVVDFTEAKHRKRLSRGFKLKAGIAAAILLTISLSAYFHSTATAEPTPLDKMYQAMQKISHIHTMQFVAGKQQPISERWVSRTLGIDKMTSNRGTVLYDMHKKIGKNKLPNENAVEQWPLAKEDVADIEQGINECFKPISVPQSPLISNENGWIRMADSELKTMGTVEVEVYERAYTTEDPSGFNIYHKRRILIDSGTFLLRRTEAYLKHPGESDYKLCSFYVYEYPSDEQMQTVIDEF